MRNFTQFLKIAGVAALCLSASPALAQTLVNARNGVCYLTTNSGPNAPGTQQPMKLEFSYRVRDGNMGAAVLVNGWPKAQAADTNTNVPVTVVLDSGKTKPSRSGGYASGYNDRLWSGWGPGELSAPLFDLLKSARTARVEADGMKLGPFDLGAKGAAYAALSKCIDEERAGGAK